MAWSETKEGLLKMMQANDDIFGKEILQIKDTDEEWLIRYFEKQLGKILHWEILGNSSYGFIDADGWGVRDSGLKPEGFGLNLHQCIKIFEYICGRVRPNNYGGVALHWTDSVVILNYIKDGYMLSESGYKFVRSTDGDMRCYKYI